MTNLQPRDPFPLSDTYDPQDEARFSPQELKQLVRDHAEMSKGMAGPDDWDLDSAIGPIG